VGIGLPQKDEGLRSVFERGEKFLETRAPAGGFFGLLQGVDYTYFAPPLILVSGFPVSDFLK